VSVAVLFAVSCNALHGRRTGADKRDAVMTLLRVPEWSGRSNVEIARRCKVSEFMVRQHRDTLRENRSEHTRPAPGPAQPGAHQMGVLGSNPRNFQNLYDSIG